MCISVGERAGECGDEWLGGGRGGVGEKNIGEVDIGCA